MTFVCRCVYIYIAKVGVSGIVILTNSAAHFRLMI